MTCKTVAYFLGTYEDWGGASRALLNFVRTVDRQRFHPVVVLTKPGNLSAKLATEGIDHVFWQKHDRTRNIVGFGVNVLRAMRFFRKHGFDLLHVNHGAIGWKPAELLAARLTGIPVVDHLHITDTEPSSFLKYCSVVVCVSKYILDRLNAFGVPKRVVHNVSDLSRFGHGRDLRQELGYVSGEILVLYMGQMIRQKGIEMFIAMARRIANPDVRFLMAGAIRDTVGAYSETEVADLVARDPRLRYLGYRTDAENLYATADIMVMPSQWEEPCAMILFESAAAGKPIVATATGGTPEIVRPEETGFLVERDDIDGMKTYVERLINDRALRERIGLCAREIAATEYAVQPISRMEAIYDSLLSGQGRPIPD